MSDEGLGCGGWLVMVVSLAVYGWWYFYGDNGPKMAQARAEALEQRVRALEVGSSGLRDALVECEAATGMLRFRVDYLNESLRESQADIDRIVDSCRCAQ